MANHLAMAKSKGTKTMGVVVSLLVVTASGLYIISFLVAGLMHGLGRKNRFAVFFSGQIEDMRYTLLEGHREGGCSSQSAPEIVTWLIGVAVLALLYVPYGLGKLVGNRFRSRPM